jgi:hypothetical protein
VQSEGKPKKEGKPDRGEEGGGKKGKDAKKKDKDKKARATVESPAA